MAARINKIRHDEETRAKIQTSQLINRLQDHIFGKVDLVPTQVQSALGLLKKTLPDLSQSETTHTVKREATDYTREELIALLAESRQEDGGAGTASEDGRGREPDSVH
jgi:hypothetical protein